MNFSGAIHIRYINIITMRKIFSCILFLTFYLLPLTSVAKDFVTPLSEFTGTKHELTSQLIIDVDAVIPQIRGFDEVYDVTTTDKTYV
jgi:hypothetical protein